MIARALLFIFLAANPTFAQKHVPTIDELMTIETLSGPQISPNAGWVAYPVNGTDFKTDTHPSQIWLANIASGDKFQLMSGPKSATAPRWFSDGEWLAFLSNRVEDKNQIFAIRPNGGEALQLSKHDTGVNSFVWSPDGKTIAYTATEPTPQTSKDRDERVPIANSYELRQALEDRGVPVEMVVYKGFGHAINKPKSMRAVMEHNLAFFNHYIFGDPAPDFVTPEPIKKSSN